MNNFIYNNFGRFFIVILIFTLILYALNLRIVFDIDRFNPIEKSTWLLISVLTVVSSRASKDALYFSLTFFFFSHFLLFGVSHPDYSYQAFLLSLTQIPILFFLCSTKLKPNEIIHMLKCFCWMPFFVIGVGVVYDVAGITELYGIEYATGLARLKGSSSAAYLASWCIASVYCSMKLAQITRKYSYYLFTISAFIIIYFTVARVPLVIAFCIATMIFFYSSPFLNVRVKSICIFGGVTVIPFVIFLLSSKYLTRVESSGSSGRDIIWDHLIYEYERYFHLWGAGFGHQYRIIPESISNITSTVAAHNEYIRIMVELGFLGSIFFWVLFSLFFVFTYLRSRSIYRFEMIVTFALFMFFSFFDNTITSPAIFCFLMCCYIFNNSVNGYEDFNR